MSSLPAKKRTAADRDIDLHVDETHKTMTSLDGTAKSMSDADQLVEQPGVVEPLVKKPATDISKAEVQAPPATKGLEPAIVDINAQDPIHMRADGSIPAPAAAAQGSVGALGSSQFSGSELRPTNESSIAAVQRTASEMATDFVSEAKLGLQNAKVFMQDTTAKVQNKIEQMTHKEPEVQSAAGVNGAAPASSSPSLLTKAKDGAISLAHTIDAKAVSLAHSLDVKAQALIAKGKEAMSKKDTVEDKDVKTYADGSLPVERNADEFPHSLPFDKDGSLSVSDDVGVATRKSPRRDKKKTEEDIVHTDRTMV